MSAEMVEASDEAESEVTVRFVDVGQGDCTVAVDHRTGDALLIDCPKGGAKTAIAALRDLGAERLAVALITHWHADHYGDVLAVADHFGTPAIHYNSEGFEADRKTSKDAKLPTLRRLADPELGQRLGFANDTVHGEIGSISWSILAPDQHLLTSAVSASHPNLACAVTRLEIFGVALLIGGDADGRSWAWLRHKSVDLKASVLRWPHHGAMQVNFTNAIKVDELLDAVGPELVAISVGSRGGHGHPNEITIRETRKRGARVVCTQAGPACNSSATPTQTLSCAGDITIAFCPDGWNVSPSPTIHQVAIRKLASPACAVG